MADFAFVVVTQINDDSPILFHGIVEFFGRQMVSNIGNIECIVTQTISYDFFTNADNQLVKRLPIILHSDFKIDVCKLWVGIKQFNKLVPIMGRNRNLSIYALMSQVNTT